MSVLTGERLSKTFGAGSTAYTALADVDISLQAGEVVVLLGPSGSGKTTLISLLAGLLRPTSGTVRLDGRVLAADDRQTPVQRLTNIGFAFQTFNLLPALTALDNVALPLRLAGVGRRRAQTRAAALLDDVHLADRRHHYPKTLSGGEQQRVSVARALVANPKVVLADEPTASLDTRTGEEVVKLLTGLARQGHQACLIVTHDTRLTEAADRLIRIQDGRLV